MQTITNRQVLALVSGGGEDKGVTVGEVAGAGGAIGGGYGASKYISSVGGFRYLPAVAFIPVAVAGATGVAIAGYAGYKIGTALYDNSEMVQKGSQAVVGGIIDGTTAISDFVAGLLSNRAIEQAVGGKTEGWVDYE